MIKAGKLISHPRFSTRANSYVRWYPKSLDTNFDISMFINQLGFVNGIYIHVPFCEILCRFCPFNKIQSNDIQIERFVDALIREIELYAHFIEYSDVQFVYFGGGTPSVMTDYQIESVMTALNGVGVVLSSCEISLEAHPRHLMRDRLSRWKNLGISRVSSGIQAFTEAELDRLGSNHNQRDVDSGLRAMSDVFENYAIDLLYRFRGHNLDEWAYSLRHVTEQRIPHVSAYALVGPQDPSEDERIMEAEMAVLTHEMLSRAGYEHYASCASGGYDYCLDGLRGRYEEAHWAAPQSSYLGLGPGAFGFVNGYTTVNGLSVDAYSQSITSGTLPLASLSKTSNEEIRRRFFILGMKTLSVSFDKYRSNFGEDVPGYILDVIGELVDLDFVNFSNERVSVSEIGRHFVDEISSAFFSHTEAAIVHPEEPEIRRAEIARRRFMSPDPNRSSNRVE